MAQLHKINPCLWFDDQAEEAARHYVSIFKDAKLGRITRYGKEGFDFHGRPEGSVMTVEFELEGTPFTALNGGPAFQFNEAVSFQVQCDDQEEIDAYWSALSEGGDPAARQCGWLKDKFGVSWQVVPRILPELLADPETEEAQRAMRALLGMKKIDMQALQEATQGVPA